MNRPPQGSSASEMRRLGKPYRVKILPASGHTSREGHNFVYRRATAWEADVFAFLDERLQHGD